MAGGGSGRVLRGDVEVLRETGEVLRGDIVGSPGSCLTQVELLSVGLQLRGGLGSGGPAAVPPSQGTKRWRERCFI